MEEKEELIRELLAAAMRHKMPESEVATYESLVRYNIERAYALGKQK